MGCYTARNTKGAASAAGARAALPRGLTNAERGANRAHFIARTYLIFTFTRDARAHRETRITI
jgi:hypothetical protein